MILTYTNNEEECISVSETNTSDLSDISSIQKDHSEFSAADNNFHFEVVYPEIFAQKFKTLTDEINSDKLDENKAHDLRIKSESSKFSDDLESSSFLNSWNNQIEDELTSKKKFCKEFEEKTNLKKEGGKYILNLLLDFFLDDEIKARNLNDSLDINKNLSITQKTKNFIPKKFFFSKSPKNTKNSDYLNEKNNKVYGSNIYN